MLYFIDQTSEKDHHMVFNSSIIQSLLLIYPTQNLIFYGIPSNQKSVLSLLSEDEKKRLTLQPIIYSKPYNDNKFFKIWNFIKKERLRSKLFKEMFAATTSTDFVFLSITTFSSFYVFKKLKQKYDVNTLVTLHGDVDFIYNASNLYERINAYSHKKLFKAKANNFYYLLLNKIAKARLVADNYLNANEVFEVNHPFNVINFPFDNHNLNHDKPIILGHIGSMELDRKNSDYFYQLANNLSELIENRKLQFNTIGLITPPMLPFKNKWVVEIVGNSQPNKPDYLTREEYETNVLKLDFALFFFKEPHYIFRASGAVIDAIAFETPLIVLNHPFFYNLFKQVGQIGYLCKDLTEMEQIIRKIANNDDLIKSDFKLFKTNLRALRNQFTTVEIAKDIENQLNSSFKNQ
jgi:hypothetical protein